MDDHVELHFISPPHNRSLAGCLKHLIDPSKLEPTDEEIDAAIEAGFAEEARVEEMQIQSDWNARHRENQTA